MKMTFLSAVATAGILLHAQAAPEDESWPRFYTVDGAEVILYEPRLDQWQGSSLDARFAVGIKLKGDGDAAYGSFAAHAEAISNPETRTVTLFNFSASEVRFSDAPDKLVEFARIIDALAPEKPVKVPLDTLLAAVPSEDVITKATVTTASRTTAPKVIVRFESTVLVAFDGQPVFRGIPGTGLEAAVNTPATLLRPENGGPLYLLTNEGLWLQAAGWAGPWSAATATPPGLDRIPSDHPVAQAVKNVWPAPGAIVSVPEVVTSETPTELIQIDGKPKYDQVAGLPLVRVSNTVSPLFYHSDQAMFYVLISGRWFIAPELTGPWTYVAHNELPAEFAQIPTDDPAADVRASVAGTREAEEAAKEAQIPTYARVNVNEAPALTVEYDGEPVFEEVPGAGLSYAVNTTYAVVLVGGRYYCCRDGLWFVAESAFGAPWRCATVLPPVIYTMPPSCPLYYTTFCGIDRFDNDYVVYRCAPGYWGTYVDAYSGVCVYGTGWSYPAYVSRDYYCGNAWTYGLGYRYLPRSGFVRGCDRVAHTSWFRHTGRGSAVCRADSDRWGGRFERDRWRGSSGRSVAYSSWNGRVATRSDDVVKSLRHSGPAKREVAQHHASKPQVVARGSAAALSSAKFDKDVRAGQQGELYRRGAEGWLRRDSGQWKTPDKNHPVDRRVADSNKSREVTKEKPHVVSTKSQGLSRDNRTPQIPAPALHPEKVGVPHETARREIEGRPAQGALGVEKKTPVMPKAELRVERHARRVDDPPAHRAQVDEKKEQPSMRIEQKPPVRVNREPVPGSGGVEHREMPRIAPKVEQREAPRVAQPQPQVQREAPRVVQPQPQVQREAPRVAQPQPQVQREAPRRVEQSPPQMRREAPRVVQPQPQVQREAPRVASPTPPQVHREAPRVAQPQPQVQREAPRMAQPQPQVHREAPRRVEQPRQSPSSSNQAGRSQQKDDKKDDKRR